MLTVYEIKANGFVGEVKQIDPREGVGPRWTYTAPPASGPHKWEHGKWVAAQEPEEGIAAPDTNALAENVRAKRNKRLADTDWMVTKALEKGVPVSAKVLEFRQALRDITEQPGFPLEIEWPVLQEDAVSETQTLSTE